MNFNSKILSTLATLLCALPAGSNDAYISTGGAPTLMKGHASISMVDEFVRIDVQTKKIVVDVTFTFKNHGNTASVTMGFPDRGDYDYTLEKPKLGELKNFKSWVRGKAVPTKTVGKPGDTWHVKTIDFKKGETVKVRNRYETIGSSTALNRNGYMRDVSYILSTGASWKGKIKHAVIEVKINDSYRKGPLKIRQSRPIDYRTFSDKLNELRPFFMCSGPSKAMLKGNIIRFERRNFEPTERDDVHIYYWLPSEALH